MATVIFGVLAGVCWAASDFNGGVASKHTPALAVVVLSQIAGAGLMVIFALGEAVPAWPDLLAGGAAGICGSLALVAYYHGLAQGRMGVTSPVTAVIAVIVPVVVGSITEGLPAPLRLAGFGLALLSVWLVSRTNSTIYLRELALPVAAGIGFGAFLTLLAFASERAVFWPLVAARVASSSVLIPLALATSSLHAERVRLPLIAVTGLLDAGGNALYALAAQFGRLDIAAVLSSLYPAGTVLLARLILKEDMSRAQWIGLGAALLAIGLITVGG